MFYVLGVKYFLLTATERQKFKTFWGKFIGSLIWTLIEMLIFVAQFIFYKKTLNGDYGPLGTSAYFFDDENQEEEEGRVRDTQEGVIIEVIGMRKYKPENETEEIEISKPVLL
jgi:hypothetical protein